MGNALTSRSLAGISERMILIPDLMPFSFETIEAVSTLLEWTAEKRNLGAVILVQSNNAAKRWEKVATFATKSEDVDHLVRQLQDRETNGPVVLANRYDGIDLLATLVGYWLSKDYRLGLLTMSSCVQRHSMVEHQSAACWHNGLNRE